MLPKWFDKWNQDNPTNVFGPAIAIGVAGGAVFVAALLITWGNPVQTSSLQTGPRGIGMSVPEFNSAVTQADPTIEGYAFSEPVVPEGGEALAKDAIENAEPLLGDLTEANYTRLVDDMRSWTGIPTLFDGEETYQTVVARRMIEMTRNINENWDGHVNANNEVGVTCYTCHRGEPVPSNIWFKISPVNESAGGWSSNQNRASALSQSTSLPSDALEKYLMEEDTIAVHSLESRVEGIPGQDDYASIQDAERTYSLMNYFANSLGVNCVFCHNSRAFYDGGQVTPQWGTASLGILMVQEMNNEYLVPLKDVYPAERLGPIYADAPKAACMTCHKGYQQPLQGLNVIGNYPELASSEAPEYE